MDGRPNRKNKAAFSYFAGVVLTLPKLLFFDYPQSWIKAGVNMNRREI